MSSKTGGGNRIVGSLRSADGRGVVRMEDRYDTDIDDLWSALTERPRLARWLGEFEGELSLGASSGPASSPAAGREPAEWRSASRPGGCWSSLGARKTPGDTIIEATLTADGDQTILVLEERGVPLNLIAEYGAGIQVHIEDLAASLTGGVRCDAELRWTELIPDYQALAAGVS